jgi:hypothetical protein
VLINAVRLCLPHIIAAHCIVTCNENVPNVDHHGIIFNLLTVPFCCVSFR